LEDSDRAYTAGIGLDEPSVVYCPFTIHAGREGLARVLDLRPRPTALICGTDLLAAGALAEAAARGVQVPDAISITGFDDVDYASLLTPPLTTVRVPASATSTIRRRAHALAGRCRRP